VKTDRANGGMVSSRFSRLKWAKRFAFWRSSESSEPLTEEKHYLVVYFQRFTMRSLPGDEIPSDFLTKSVSKTPSPTKKTEILSGCYWLNYNILRTTIELRNSDRVLGINFAQLGQTSL
jgi:hypothetical protein